MHSLITNTYKRVTTKFDSENMDKELFVRTLTTIQQSLIKTLSCTIQTAVAQ